MRTSQVTIKDLARELGISPSTVSRALKDHPDISPRTKESVKQLAEKLHYQPNIIALSLRKSHTNTIGVIIPEIVHFFFSTVISGIEDVAYSAGYNVIISQSNESYERELTDTNALFNSRVDGLLVSISRETKNFDHFKWVHENGVPIVFFDRVCSEIDSSKVVVDDFGGSKDAVKYLVDQGRKRIAHLAGPENLLISKSRLNGYKQALMDANIPIDESLIIDCGHGTEEEGKASFEKLMELSNPPDAIFANNDIAAFGSMVAAKEHDYKIPEDISIIGFSDWRFSSIIEPSLSSVAQPGFEMGQESAKLLIHEIESEEETIKHQTKVLPAKFIPRQSSNLG